MTAGLPGTGLGGIFYLIISLIMFSNEIIKKVLGTKNNEKTTIAKLQFFIFLGIIISISLLNWLMGKIVFSLIQKNNIGHAQEVISQFSIPQNSLLLSFAFLAAIFIFVELIRLFFFLMKTVKKIIS